MSDIHNARVWAILERIAARLGISVDDLANNHIPDRPQFGGEAERAATIAELEALVEHGTGPQEMIGHLLRILKSASA